MVDLQQLIIITEDGQSIKVTDHCIVRFMQRSGGTLSLYKAMNRIAKMLDQRKEARMKRSNNNVSQIIKHNFKPAKYYLDPSQIWVLVLQEGNVLTTIYKDEANRYIFK